MFIRNFFLSRKVKAEARKASNRSRFIGVLVFVGVCSVLFEWQIATGFMSAEVQYVKVSDLHSSFVSSITSSLVDGTTPEDINTALTVAVDRQDAALQLLQKACNAWVFGSAGSRKTICASAQKETEAMQGILETVGLMQNTSKSDWSSSIATLRSYALAYQTAHAEVLKEK